MAFTPQQQQMIEGLPKGPDFIDSNQCRCSLQATNVQQSDNNNNLISEAWRCTANATNNAYSGASGKWFVTQNPPDINGLDFAQNESWAGNPPKLDTTYFLQGPDNRRNGSLVVYDGSKPNALLPDDQGCTGQNDSSLSTQYYNQVQIQLQNHSQELRFTCLQKGSVGLSYGNVSQFMQEGCPLGFYCKLGGCCEYLCETNSF